MFEQCTWQWKGDCILTVKDVHILIPSVSFSLFLLHGNRLLLGLTVTTATEYCLLTAVRTSTGSRDKDVLGTTVSRSSVTETSCKIQHLHETIAKSVT